MKCLITIASVGALLCSSVYSAPLDFPKNLPVGLPDDIESDVIGEPLDFSDFQFEFAAQDSPLNDEPEDNYDWIKLAGAFEGDIILSDLEQLNQLNQSAAVQNNAVKQSQKIWSKGVIPYVISNSFNAYERGQIASAMASYHAKTCIKFVPRSSHRDYIHLYRGSGCSSMVGKQGGKQVVSLGNGCFSTGVIIHELMHAAGFWHEQSRADRDSYIRINWGNIITGMEYNFQKYNWNTIQHLNEPYNLRSIMHYGSKAFSKNGRNTLDAINGGNIGHLGQRGGFSQIDLNKLKKLYKCGGTTTTTTTTGGGNRNCKDLSPFCNDWSKKGECSRNPAYMNISCKKACNKCGNTTTTSKNCKDKNKFCGDWARKGECTRNAAFMMGSCKKSCNVCAPRNPANGASNCADQNDFCSDWASKGHCQSNPAYMLVSCKNSCNAC